MSRVLAAQHRGDDVQRLSEPIEAVGERPELETECVVLAFVPARADAENRPPTADHVEGCHRLGQDRRVAIRVAGNESGELNLLGDAGQCAEGRVALQHRFVGLADAGQLVEVVHQQERVESGGFGLAGLGDHPRKDLRRSAGIGEVGDLVAHPNRHQFDATGRRKQR